MLSNRSRTPPSDESEPAPPIPDTSPEIVDGTLCRPGPFAGGIALAAYTIGVLARLDAEAIENSDSAPRRRASDCPRLPAFQWRTAVSHLLLRGSCVVGALRCRCFALSMYRCEVVTRETVIVGLVGTGGLGRMLAQQNASFDEPTMLTTIITLIAVSLAIDLISARVRAAIR